MADEELDAKPAAESSPEAPSDVKPTDSSPVEGDVAQGSPATEPESAKPDEKSARAALIAELTSGTQEIEPEAEEAEGGEEITSAPETAADATVTETPKSAPTGKQDDPPAALTEEELTEPVDNRIAPKTKRRIEALLEERKQTKPLADYAKSIFELQKAAGISAEDFGAWIALGMDVHTKPENMAHRLLAQAKAVAAKQGVKLIPDAPAQARLPENFDDFIFEQVSAGEMSPEAAKKLRETLKPLRATAVPEPVKPPVSAPAAPVQTPVSTPQAIDPRIKAADDRLKAKEAEYLKKYPADWAKLRPVVQAGMAKYKGTDPSTWPDFLDREVQDAIRTLVKPTPKVPPPTLRPAGATNQAKTDPQGKAAIIAELTGRK